MESGSSERPMRVLVTGASGKTGALVVQELLRRPEDFAVAVVVRSSAAHKLMLDLGVMPGSVFRADLAGGDAAGAAAESAAVLRGAVAGCQALVICTSAVPQVAVLPTLFGGLRAWAGSLARRLSLWGGGAGEAEQDAPFVPVASWKGGQTPEQVDWHGQRAQIDAARASGTVEHVVLVSSAGGCDPRHFLNHIGGAEGGGDILNHKRRAEQHLVATGLTYTILHPNHLVDVPAGRHQVVLAVDDQLQQQAHWRKRLKMPRGDLAALVVQSLLLRDAGAGNRSVDCAARPPPPGEPPTTTTEQFRHLFAAMAANCDYSLNDRTRPDAVWACQPPAAAGGGAAQ